MEKKLKALFDFQKYEQNPRLNRLIAETEQRGARALSDEDLFFVNAAGVPEELLGKAPKKE